MAQTKKFFEGPVDKTPYGNCVFLAATVAVVFFAGAWSLWSAAGYFKQNTFFHLPSLPGTSSSNGDLMKNVKDAASNMPSETVENATQQAKDAAAAEAQKQLDEQKESAQTQAEDQIKQYLFK